MLWNPGRLPADWTITHLLEKHASQPFNPDIANVFFRAGMVDSWGRGIERIMQACKDARVPMPELRYEQTGLWVIFSFLSPNRVGEKVGKKVGKKLTANQEKILLQLRQNANLSARELADLVGISSRKIEQNISRLKKLGRLRRIGPPKGGHWEVLG
jgi:ATP-dependent DNA helicase RecG